MRLRDLRRELQAAGIDTSSCFDRESMLELLEANREALASGHTPAAEPQAGGAALEPEVVVGPGTGSAAPPPGVVEVPLIDMGDFVAVDLAVGPQGTPARFVLDTGGPSVVNIQATSFLNTEQVYDTARRLKIGEGAALPPEVEVLSLGQASLGGLDCGELLAVLMGVPTPMGCCGFLGLDFLRTLHWEIDLPARRARVAPAGGAPVPFDLCGLKRVPLRTVKPAAGIEEAPEVLGVDLEVRRKGAMPSAAQAGSSSLMAGMARCTGVVGLSSAATACSPATVEQLQLGPGELRAPRHTVTGLVAGGGMDLQQASVTLVLGEAPEGPVEVEADIFVGHPGLEQAGFDADAPVAFLGLDVLCRSRMVFSLASGSLWLSP